MGYMLSTCGTSTLTNNTSGELKQALTVYANAAKGADVPKRECELIEEHIMKRKNEFAALSVQDAREASAELNGILAFYGGRPAKGKNDCHCLLATDTWLGRATADIVRTWLENNDIGNVEVYSHRDLQTADLQNFQSSLADLVKWCVKNVEPRRSPHNRIIFNLSGGFKSATGFLQLLGMFYADEVIYIFERSGELLRIPRLPIAMEDEPAIRRDLRDFRRASQGLAVTARKTDDVYWFEIDGRYDLTGWGGLVFENLKKKLYLDVVHDSPSGKVKFGPQFLASCTERHAEINRRIDLLAKYMELPQRPNPNTLDFKELKGGGNPAVPGATHECDAWHDGAAKRIYCRLEKDAVVLLKLGHALH